MQIKNVPAITPRYWVAILVASMCGANTGDFLSHNLDLGHWRGLPLLAIVFLAILWFEGRVRTATEAYYWLAIIVIRTAATNLADLLTHDLKLGYAVIEPGLTLLLIVLVLADRTRQPDTAPLAGGLRRPMVPTTNALYWLAMFTAGTLGTASGDFTAGVAGLGLFYGSAVLSVLFIAVLAVAWYLGDMSKPWYWASIVGARTAGTTLGDMLASRHGLDLGLSVSTLLTGSMLAAVILFWPHRRDMVAVPVR
jgi:uncharacterized membrane-anchored protein